MYILRLLRFYLFIFLNALPPAKPRPGESLEEAISLTFQLTQYLRDESLIRSIASYLDCGKIYKNRGSIYLDTTKFSDLTGKVIPGFKKHPIMGKKILDFEDFCKVAELMQNKAHLTQSGLEETRKIKADWIQVENNKTQTGGVDA